MSELGGQIANRSERREVECDLVFYWDRSVVEVVRKDSGEVVDQRGITTEERQQKMPFAAKSEGAKVAPAPGTETVQ